MGNLAFIIAIVMRFWGDIFQNETISSYVITAGFAVIVLNSVLFILFLYKKSRFYFQPVPAWLMITNLVFYLTELWFYFTFVL